MMKIHIINYTFQRMDVVLTKKNDVISLFTLSW